MLLFLEDANLGLKCCSLGKLDLLAMIKRIVANRYLLIEREVLLAGLLLARVDRVVDPCLRRIVAHIQLLTLVHPMTTFTGIVRALLPLCKVTVTSAARFWVGGASIARHGLLLLVVVVVALIFNLLVNETL